MAIVNVKDGNGAMQTTKIVKALEKIGNNLTPENIIFLGELASKSNINKKLESKKGLIKSFV